MLAFCNESLTEYQLPTEEDVPTDSANKKILKYLEHFVNKLKIEYAKRVDMNYYEKRMLSDFFEIIEILDSYSLCLNSLDLDLFA